MIKTITETVVDGYGSGETDFLTRLSQAGQSAVDEFESNIIQPILAVLNNSNQSAVLTITGHSDRVDDAGLTREQRRAKELAGSQARAESANDAVRQRISSEIAGLPADLDELQELAILFRVAGAALLRESGDPLTESQRRQNRRVQFRVVRFEMS